MATSHVVHFKSFLDQADSSARPVNPTVTLGLWAELSDRGVCGYDRVMFVSTKKKSISDIIGEKDTAKVVEDYYAHPSFQTLQSALHNAFSDRGSLTGVAWKKILYTHKDLRGPLVARIKAMEDICDSYSWGSRVSVLAATAEDYRSMRIKQQRK